MAPFRQVPRRVSSSMQVLRKRGLDSASPSSATELREATLQTRIIVTTLQLDALNASEESVPDGFWKATRPFASVVDIAILINRQLGRVSAEYAASKKQLRQLQLASFNDQLADLIATAETGLDAIGREPSITCFLAARASVRDERCRSACRMIAMPLGGALPPQHGLSATHDSSPRCDGAPKGECNV